jgi:hypothetical protein
MGHLNPDTGAVNAILCLLNILLCGYAAWIAYTGLAQSAPDESASSVWHSSEVHAHGSAPKDARLHLNIPRLPDHGITFLCTAS